MKINFKSFVIGAIAGVMIAGSSVFAITGAVQKTLEYNDIKITLNGQEISPTDANGAYVEPFTIDGTTYLPVRAIGNALGLSVNWDDETKTVVLGKDNSGSQASGTVVYDKNGIRISYAGYIDNNFFKTYKLLIENNSSTAIHIYCDYFYTDGFLLHHKDFGAAIDPGKKHVGTIDVTERDLQECGLTDIDNFEFKVYIQNLNTNDYIVKDEIVNFEF